MSSKSAAASKPVAGPSRQKVPSLHPTYAEMIVQAIRTQNEPTNRKGVSVQAIKKYISTNFQIETGKVAVHLKKGLKSAAEHGNIVRVKGTGASGSFKLNKDGGAAKPKAVKRKPSVAAKPKEKKEKTATKSKADATKASTSSKKAKAPSVEVKKAPAKKVVVEKKSSPKTTKAAPKAVKSPVAKKAKVVKKVAASN